MTQTIQKDVKSFDKSISSKNKRGEYVPAIPAPYYGLKKICRCGASFWTDKGYEGHYALEHILGM